MEPRTPFDAALGELLRAWRCHDDLRRRGGATLREQTVAWLELERARSWVRALAPAEEPLSRRGRPPGS